VQAFPLAQVDLTELDHRGRVDPQRLADQLCGLGRPLQVARVKSRESPAAQPAAQAHRLAPPFLGKWGVQLALDPALVIPGRLAVAHEQQARGWGGLARLRMGSAGLGLL
jgi:hypothetical protein